MFDFIKRIRNTGKMDFYSYYKLIAEINNIRLGDKSDSELREMSERLQKRAANGCPEDELMVEAYALVKETVKRVLHIEPFDVQVIAGICLHEGKLVEMQTGEGKTLAAVMPAYLNALSGKGVHVLTFNDYLAQRDAEWMGPVYEFLGLSVGFVSENMENRERQKAYRSHITYVTAREAGFDYLRDFLCTDKSKLVHRPFNYAVVDEADSIMLDEARIPLVIAGEIKVSAEKSAYIDKVVKELEKDKDYEMDQNGRNVFLTDAGLLHAERILGCGNLYKQRNLELLTGLNCALHAHLLLQRDRDYIVRNGKIEIVDEFTGRIADKRHWPDKLQAAVAAKEGIADGTKGIIMDSITMQHFLSLYPKISGMTGTACTAAEEFADIYCLEVVVVPTNKPCIRLDHSPRFFTHKVDKNEALLEEIERIQKTGQPILVGTGSVEESEALAEGLYKLGIKCSVLNARNDEMEARIIAGAGECGAVTVSTNMAGRGVDIKLGEGAATLGGLYVIGTSLNESRRIDNQLKGRSGRQGDPGESRFFISLEDELMGKYGITEISSIYACHEEQLGVVDEPGIINEVLTAQRMVEGYNSDLTLQLAKYSFIIEQQRRILHDKRQSILEDRVQPEVLQAGAAEKYYRLRKNLGDEVLKKVEKQLALHFINKYWSEHLDYVSYIREGIHLVAIGKKNPLHEFNKAAVEAFDEMLQNIETAILETFNDADIDEAGIDFEKEGLEVPASTWVYLINDSGEQFSGLHLLLKAASNYINKPLFTLKSIFERISLKRN